MSAIIKGPWSQVEIHEFLSGALIPLRLSTVGADGYPRVVSLWFCLSEGNLLAVSHRDAPLVALLREHPKIGFEVAPNEPPYYGVRGQGLAELSAEGAAATLEQLIERYLAGSNSQLARWLMSRADEELLVRITPQRLFSWDYRTRMEQ